MPVKRPSDLKIGFYSSHGFCLESIPLEGSRPQKIKTKDLPAFIDDTETLVRVIGEAVLKKNYDLAAGFKDLQKYWHKWGSLLPPDLKNEGLVSLRALETACLAGILWLDVWQATNWQECSGLTQRVIDSFYEAVGGFQNEKYLTLMVNLEPDVIQWMPSTNKRFKDAPFVPWIFLEVPTASELANDGKFNLFKKLLTKNIGYYLNSNQKFLDYEARLIQNNLEIKAYSENRFLVWLLIRLKEGKEIIPVCEICGKPLTGLKTRFCSEQCKNRSRETRPDRKLKAWLRLQKSRGKITNERYIELCTLIEDLLKAGENPEKIRAKIKALI